MRVLLFMLVVSLLAVGTVEAKHHGQGEGPGGGHKNKTQTAVPEGSRPPGLKRQDKTPPGLEKKDKTPPGWTKGKKKGWWKSRTSESKDAKPAE